MSLKPLPPSRPPGSLDLLDAGPDATPRAGDSDPSWRADALGRSRHSRLASGLREPLDDSDPDRAERLCAEVARDALGDLAPALLLLSPDRRRRVQALTAWTVALFDLAFRPGLAGLDGDRLAQINAWEYRTEEALDGNPPGQPVFIMLAREAAAIGWPREAIDEIVKISRRMALADKISTAGEQSEEVNRSFEHAAELARALLEALFGTRSAGAASALSPLLGVAVAHTQLSPTLEAPSGWAGIVETSRAIDAPPGWRWATSYARHALKARLRLGSSGVPLGLSNRLRLLARSIFW